MVGTYNEESDLGEKIMGACFRVWISFPILSSHILLLRIFAVRTIMIFARFGRQSESVKPIEYLCKTIALLLVSCACWPVQISPKYRLLLKCLGCVQKLQIQQQVDRTYLLKLFICLTGQNSELVMNTTKPASKQGPLCAHRELNKLRMRLSCKAKRVKEKDFIQYKIM